MSKSREERLGSQDGVGAPVRALSAQDEPFTPPLPPTEGETLTPDVKEIVDSLEGLRDALERSGYDGERYATAGIDLNQASQGLLRLAGERDEAIDRNARLVEECGRLARLLSSESSRTQAEGKMKGYGRQTIPSAQHCTGWRDISSAPIDGEEVLLGWSAVETPFAEAAFRQAVGRWDAQFDTAFDGEETVYRGAWTDYSVASWGYEEFRELLPTHWMPLPTPPEDPA